MWHLPVDLYQVSSYDALGVKTDPFLVVTSWNVGTKKADFKFFFSETGKRRALIFGMQHLLVELYHVCSCDAP